MAEKTEIVISAVDATKAAFASVQSGLGSVERSFGALDGVASRLPILASGMAAVFGGVSFTSFIRDSIGAMTALDDMAEKTGASVETLSALADVAKVGGHDLGLVEAGAIRLTKALADADDEASGAGRAFKALGINAAELRGMDTGDALKVVADRLAQFSDSGGKSAVVMDLLGKSGAQLLPYLNDLAGTQQLVTKVTSEQAAEAEKLEKSLNAIKVAAGDMARTLAVPTVNALNDVIKNFNLAREAGLGFMQAITGIGVRGLGESIDDAKKNSGDHVKALQEEIASLEKDRDRQLGFGAGASAASVQVAIDNATNKLKYYKALQAEYVAETNKASYSNEGRRSVQTLAGYESKEGRPDSKSKGKTASGKSDLQRLLELGQKNELDAYYETGGEETMRVEAEKRAVESARAETREREKANTAAESALRKYRDMIDPLQKYRVQLEEVASLEGLNDAERLEATWQINEAMDAEIEKLKGVGDEAKKTNDTAQALGLTFVSAFEDAVIGGKNASDVIKGLGQDIERIIMRKTVTEPLEKAVSGMLSGFDFGNLFGGFKASGGPVDAGKFYVVGENGPELLMAGSNGTVIPNSALGGGGTSIVINAPIDARGADASVVPQLRQALAELEARVYKNVPAVMGRASASRMIPSAF